MKIRLMDIACTRSGDKGDSSNIGVVFEYEDVYEWAVENLTTKKVKEYLDGIAIGDVIRYELPNLLSLNFLIKGSLEGGGSDSLLHDAQGKTHGQLLLLLELDVPDSFKQYLYSLNDKYIHGEYIHGKYHHGNISTGIFSQDILFVEKSFCRGNPTQLL